jgi:demethylmenaquinone methyltransferase/2-methoxy-6-polyprenyl-1,4-benzoquinol methylase
VASARGRPPPPGARPRRRLLHRLSRPGLVDEALEPGGRVFFFDDNLRTEDEVVEGVHSPVVRRQLNDGTAFRVIKVAYEPADLERRLRALEWQVTFTGTAGPFYWGTGGR